MTSPSPRKRRTIVSSRSAARPLQRVGLLAALGAAAVLGGCHPTHRDPLLTYFNAQAALTLQYPASWRTEQAQQEGVWYRYFLAPPSGSQRKSAVSATLLVGPLEGPIEGYASAYLGENVQPQVVDATRPGLRGKRWTFTSPDGTLRYSLLLLTDDPPLKSQRRVVGLYCQGQAASFADYADVLDEMSRSLSVERVADYVEYRDDKNHLTVRVPPTWHRERRLSRGATQLVQYASPALAADKRGMTARATLTIGVEPAPGGLEAFYSSTLQTLGDAFRVARHEPWHGGYADIMVVETGLAESRIKRYYRAADGKGYWLAFEARDDVYDWASPWFDVIASTLRVGSETDSKTDAKH
jgi:catechol 2,3-dioxygenase-like lactoylglutathione lyase family enzyme